MATEVQSTNRYTSRKVEVDGITLYDSDARFRKNFLKKHLKNTVDVVRFSYMMGQLAVKPIIGPLIRKSLELHYRYIHTNSVVVPIEVAKDIIRNTTDIAVSPCVCRTVRGNCDNPINTCFGLNFYGQLKKKAGERAVSVEECLAVAEMAHKRNLIAVVESCVQPYQDNLCFCCPCCCMPLTLKTKFHVPFVNYNGPYLPEFNESECVRCGKCVKACPVGALAMALYLMSYRSVFAVAYAGVMAESLADSMASKIGPLSKHAPRDLCTGKVVPTGLSGGVTRLGTLAEALGAAVIAAIWGFGTKSLTAALLVFSAGFLGAMADSVFGSCLQAKFRCPVCNTLTERDTHCNAPGTLVSGFRRITNDTVNLLSNTCALGLSLLICTVAF